MLAEQCRNRSDDMTVHALVRSETGRGWTLRCDLCGHTFDAAAAGQAEAVDFARTNGWIVGEVKWCPICAATHTTWRTT